MTNYISDVLYFFQHTPPSKAQYSSRDHITIRFVNNRQFSKGPDLSKHINKKETKDMQSAVGLLLYYARDIDSTMLPALN